MRRLPYPHSLRGRLIALILLTLMIAQTASIYLFFDERELALRNTLGLEAASRAANIVQLLENSPADYRATILRAADSPLVRFSVNVSATVDIAATNDMEGLEDWIRNSLGETAKREIRVNLRAIQPMVIATPEMPQAMQAMHRNMMENRTEPLELDVSIALNDGNWLNVRSMFHRPPLQYAWASVLMLLTTAALIGAVLWFALGRIIRPLNNLAGVMGRFGKGEAVSNLEPTGPDEVRHLTAVFNVMREQLTRFVSERTRLLAGLGHDLRSPLTAMKLRLELIEDGENRERLHNSVEEMQSMVEATLAFARAAASQEERRIVDIGQLVEDLSKDIRDAGGRADVSAPAGLTVLVQTTGFKRALRNVLENAIRYGGVAHVRARRQDGMIEILVKDEGPGIPEDMLDTVFAPFVRLEASRSLDTGGTGLGLAIARDQILSSGGEITLTNRPEGGLEARITVPEHRPEK